MKSSELKTILKPLIKQCIKEVILEEGMLSNIVSEVVQGLGATRIDESHSLKPATESSTASSDSTERKKQQLKEVKDRMTKAVGATGYNGVNIFEDVKPLKSAGKSQPGSNPLSDIAPEDPGVNIDGILKIGAQRWKNLI